MDAVYLPLSPSYIPFNIQGEPEEMSYELCFPCYYNLQESIPPPSSSFTDIFSSSKLKSEDSQLKKEKHRKRSSSEKNVMERKPPTDYIYVRARRGQATDSHSLAERVRRERISERMKTLQDLVPGCDKVTGKVLILNEIINYVESLKNQVEFLSMKLASVNPILYEFGLNFDDFQSTPEHLNNMIQSSHIQSIGDKATVIASSSTSGLHGQGSIAFPQDSGSYFMTVGDQTEAPDHQFDLYSMC